MLFAIGAMIGFIMGMTGAGGALIAIPLFMHFFGMTLKEASTFSLVAVVVAAFSNFYFQRKESHVRLAFTFVFSSVFGSFISQYYKNSLPEVVIALILTCVALYSLYTVWAPQKEIHARTNPPHFSITLVVGFLLGVLTTFTGLGGGVLMLPILISFYKLPQKAAVATSLLVVGLSSLASFIIQLAQGAPLKMDGSLIELVVGIIIMSLLLKIVIPKLPSAIVENGRKIIFSLVVGIALIKIF